MCLPPNLHEWLVCPSSVFHERCVEVEGNGKSLSTSWAARPSRACLRREEGDGIISSPEDHIELEYLNALQVMATSSL